ncbi:MAG: CPXCG motif-containing cysteine-rich protein [Deltaproteobacteria bacterium]|nr:CPXCG motif-containing cysteine-rich protein [Deltaproteobacteria bacterium]
MEAALDRASASGSPKCPWCGETIWLQVDTGGGDSQTVIEDCPVCCRPITVHWTRTGGRWRGDTIRS